jgi:uncharacterized membrane protein YqhA
MVNLMGTLFVMLIVNVQNKFIFDKLDEDNFKETVR